MRMVAGAILILSATVLYSAAHLGDVLHDSTAVGTPAAGLMTVVAMSLGLIGAAGTVWGFLSGSDGVEDPPRRKG